MQRLALLAQGAGAPVIAAADPALVVGNDWPANPNPMPWSDDRVPAWTALRRDKTAQWLALTFPRFLLRMPYGADDDPCETVPFEEASEHGLGHDAYLWGHGGFVLAILLAQQFAASGTSPRLAGNLQLDGLPLYLRRADGHATVQPCAEVLTSERWASDLLEHGVIPLMSVKDEDSVRLARIQSVALPPTRLAGRWS
jgi:type VI secretion system protein ImpC